MVITRFPNFISIYSVNPWCKNGLFMRPWTFPLMKFFTRGKSAANIYKIGIGNTL